MNPQLLTADYLHALGLRSDTLLFALNFDFVSPPHKKPNSKRARMHPQKYDIDLDIACALYDDQCRLVEMVWFKQLRDRAESIRHQGDSLNGRDRGDHAMYHAPLDQEQIRLYLQRIPAPITSIALLLHSYRGQPIRQVDAGEVHLSDDEGNRAFELNLKQLPADCRSLWIGQLRREVDDWHLSTQYLPLDANDLPNAADQVAREIARVLPAPAAN